MRVISFLSYYGNFCTIPHIQLFNLYYSQTKITYQTNVQATNYRLLLNYLLYSYVHIDSIDKFYTIFTMIILINSIKFSLQSSKNSSPSGSNVTTHHLQRVLQNSCVGKTSILITPKQRALV